MPITLYTTHCPKCKVLQSKLDSKRLEYEIFTDVPTMVQMGFMSMPKLKIGEQIMDFQEAIQYVNTVKGI